MPLAANMNISTNLNGRLRNTSLPLSCGLLPLFEAVINSIHGLEEANIPTESGWIRVVIERDMVHSLFDTVEDNKSGRQPLNDITSFTVTDNGVGFNDDNFDAFLTLDTDHKIDKGGRGIGRLLWLKAFQRVDVASVFLDGGVLRQRVFQFSTAGVTAEAVTPAPTDATRQTTVSLRGFDAGYRAKTRKTAEAIAKAMLEHCLWNFVREGGCPRIVLEDDGEQIRLDEVFEQHMHSSAVRQRAILKDRPFDLLHVKLRTSAATRHAIAYCANNRLVLEEKLEGRVPGLHGNLDDEEGEFAYLCYVSSQMGAALFRRRSREVQEGL